MFVNRVAPVRGGDLRGELRNVRGLSAAAVLHFHLEIAEVGLLAEGEGG